tara:strand:- start:952 stop:1530 length:579 start_codon:yes stop_codon:yes gene_type:complete
MTFDKLADRCMLFIDERRALLVELLKEAEIEMTRECNMYEDSRVYSCDGSESYGLPSNYKQIIFIQHDGSKLYPINEDEVSYGSDGKIQTGTPTGYFIRNGGIHLNNTTTDGKIRIHYYGTVDGAQDTSKTPSPVIPGMFHISLCDYAIAIAAARKEPNTHAAHWAIWKNNLDTITNQDANRELIHTIKREV